MYFGLAGAFRPLNQSGPRRGFSPCTFALPNLATANPASKITTGKHSSVYRGSELSSVQSSAHRNATNPTIANNTGPPLRQRHKPNPANTKYAPFHNANPKLSHDCQGCARNRHQSSGSRINSVLGLSHISATFSTGISK